MTPGCGGVRLGATGCAKVRLGAARCAGLLLVLAACAAPAWAQERLPVGTHVGSEMTAVSAPAPAPSINYDGEGRDPFVSLLVTKKAAANAPKPVHPKPGLAGVALADISVKGIMHNGAAIMAVLEGPGGKSFVARAADPLQDGAVKRVEPDAVVFTQRVVDAVGTPHTREVRKPLRTTLIEVEEDR